MAIEYNELMTGWDSSPSISKERYKLAYIQVRCTLTDFTTYMRVDFIPPDAILNSLYIPITISFMDVNGAAFNYDHTKWEYDAPGEIEKFAILFANQVSADTHPIVFKDHGIAGGAPYLGTKSFKVDSANSEYAKLAACLADPDYSAGNFEGLLKTYVLDVLNVAVNNFPAAVTNVTVDNFPAIQDVNIEQVNALNVSTPDGVARLPMALEKTSVVQQVDLNNIAGAVLGTPFVPVNIKKVNDVTIGNDVPVTGFPSTQGVNITHISGVGVGTSRLPVNIEMVNGIEIGNDVPVTGGSSTVSVDNFPSVQDVNIKTIGNDATKVNSSNGNMPVDLRASSTTQNVQEVYPVSSVAVNNFPAVQNVLEQNPITIIDVMNTVSVDVANQPIAVEVGNFPAVQDVSVTNFPAVQDVLVGNFPAVQDVSEVAPLTEIAVNNFPAVQDVNIEMVDNFPIINGKVPVNSVNDAPTEVNIVSIGHAPQVGSTISVIEDNPLTEIAVNNFPAPITDIAVNNFPDPMNVNIESDNSGLEDNIQEYENK